MSLLSPNYVFIVDIQFTSFHPKNSRRSKNSIARVFRIPYIETIRFYSPIIAIPITHKDEKDISNDKDQREKEPVSLLRIHRF